VSLSATVIVPTVGAERAVRLLESLAGSGGDFETIVVDNGTGAPELLDATRALDGAEVMSLESNLGYSRAVNLAVGSAQGEALVLLNDDSVVDPGFVDRITEPLDPPAGVVMAAGVMRDAASPGLIETAGIEVDRTLLAFDYLNGEPVEVLDRGVADPIGPSAAAAAFSRDAFLEAGGFDEALFAYLEDVDLVLRLRQAGGRCRLAKEASGLHEHSASLGSGSARKDFLMGFGRGYLLRKWGVLTPRRLPAVAARELTLVAGQAVIDRNLAGLRGRVRGLRTGRRTRPYPAAEVLPDPPPLSSTLRRRWRRRARLRRRSD
jgi:N-acetylglucosaminyl-diphospho-decaprenol L-rhamnosyltransferase